MGLPAIDEIRLEQFSNAELKLECLKRGVDVHNSEYLNLTELLRLTTRPVRELYEHYADKFLHATGSSHNHQAWVGGYIHHIVECLNIARWVYSTSPRPLPFTLPDALLVLFLHDIEKPFKWEFHWSTKEARRNFRETLIQQNQISLTDEQKNALLYVEGEHDYSNKERKMKPLAAFCHTCDILSARLWWNRGKEREW